MKNILAVNQKDTVRMDLIENRMIQKEPDGMKKP